LNRLDNDTAGFLYFAKTKSIKEEYKKLQDEQQITKVYIANVEGRVDVERTVEKHEELRSTLYFYQTDVITRHPE
jgi:23S rRNA-/tRNA-specific pseudouridylate synthase